MLIGTELYMNSLLTGMNHITKYMTSLIGSSYTMSVPINTIPRF